MTQHSDIDIDRLLIAFGAATIRAIALTGRTHDLEKLVDQLRLDAHHQNIRITALTESNAHLTIKLNAAADDGHDTTCDLEPIDVDEPHPPIMPRIIHPFKSGNDLRRMAPRIPEDSGAVNTEALENSCS